MSILKNIISNSFRVIKGIGNSSSDSTLQQISDELSNGYKKDQIRRDIGSTSTELLKEKAHEVFFGESKGDALRRSVVVDEKKVEILNELLEKLKEIINYDTNLIIPSVVITDGINERTVYNFNYYQFLRRKEVMGKINQEMTMFDNGTEYTMTKLEVMQSLLDLERSAISYEANRLINGELDKEFELELSGVLAQARTFMSTDEVYDILSDPNAFYLLKNKKNEHKKITAKAKAKAEY